MTSASDLPSDAYGTRLVWCLTITVAVVAFFWAYDAIAHREAPYYPEVARATGAAPAPAADFRATAETPAAPAPNMNSPEVEFANADVAVTLPVPASKLAEAKPAPTAAAEIVVKKKKRIHIVARARPNAPGLNAYAQYSPFPQSLFGGF
jgi:hypothetical protein